jgi:streptogramin lyase
VVEAGELIYAATPYSLEYFNKADNSINQLNKVTPDGLSDIGISSIGYSSELQTLVVAYSNTNIDLVKSGSVINIPDIKRKQILGNKTINQVYIQGKLAYLACGFGIVVIDIEKAEIKDTYFIGPQASQIDVKSITYQPETDKFFAATEKGIFSAPASSNMADYANWTKDMTISGPNDNFNLIQYFAGKIYANKTKYQWATDTLFVLDNSTWQYFQYGDFENRFAMSVTPDKLVICRYYGIRTYSPEGNLISTFEHYNNDKPMEPRGAVYDKAGNLWVADQKSNIWSINPQLVGTNYTFDGPWSARTTDIDIKGRQVWVVPGGHNASYGNIYNLPSANHFDGTKWISYNYDNLFNTPEMNMFRDVVCVVADPLEPSHAFAGSWGFGLLEFKNDSLYEIYTPENSTLQYVSGYGVGYNRVGGVAFDSQHNLWVTNSGVGNVLSVRKPDGEWKSFNLGSESTGKDVGSIMIDNHDHIWVQCRDHGILVFNYNNTIDNTADDQVRKLTAAVGNGNLPGNGVASMAVDRDGVIWIGADQGVARIFTPENIFNGGDFDAALVKIQEGIYIFNLLKTEAITAITVNGNNEKWLGTDKSGVFLMSADGTEEIQHFTAENSSLLSNSIQAIEIASDGEVYFGTSLGLVSYKDYKVEPPTTLDSLMVYPNPVKPGYKGPVFISNVVADADIKITDVSGALVWETEAQGGQVLWDGNNLKGEAVVTGMYYIFVTNYDGSLKKSAKLLIIR